MSRIAFNFTKVENRGYKTAKNMAAASLKSMTFRKSLGWYNVSMSQTDGSILEYRAFYEKGVWILAESGQYPPKRWERVVSIDSLWGELNAACIELEKSSLDISKMQFVSSDPVNYREIWRDIGYRGETVNMERIICLDKLGRQSHTAWHVIGDKYTYIPASVMENARASRLFR